MSDSLRPYGLQQVVLGVKNSPANAGDVGNVGSIPGLGRSPGGGHGNSLQHSCLENPIDREAWRAMVHRVAKSWTQLKWLRMLAWTAACQASLSFTTSQSLLKFMSIKLVMPSKHLILSFCLQSFPAWGSYSSSILYPHSIVIHIDYIDFIFNSTNVFGGLLCAELWT